MSDAPAIVQLEGELTIYRASELKPLLLAAVDSAAALRFDLAQVSEIDSAGVQLLLLAQREASVRGATLQLCAPSPAVSQAFALLALSAHLQATAQPAPARA